MDAHHLITNPPAAAGGQDALVRDGAMTLPPAPPPRNYTSARFQKLITNCLIMCGPLVVLTRCERKERSSPFTD